MNKYDPETFEEYTHKCAAKNACANISTKDLESGCIQKLVEAAREVLPTLDYEAHAFLEERLKPFKENVK